MSEDGQNLSRRKFIKLGTASAAGIASAGVIAASLMHQTPIQAQTDGGMGDMPGMDMGGHAGHMGAAPQGAPVLPEGEALRDLPRLANEASTPGLFKATLTAQSATVRFAEELDTPILAYNGTSPGPLIEAAEGDRVEITFANRIADEASTIHWHGMPVPADQDGNPMDPVATGTDRTYSFDLPEGSAGSYWYHPHPHGKTAEQVYRGLAGAFVVRSKTDPIPRRALRRRDPPIGHSRPPPIRAHVGRVDPLLDAGDRGRLVQPDAWRVLVDDLESVTCVCTCARRIEGEGRAVEQRVDRRIRVRRKIRDVLPECGRTP